VLSEAYCVCVRPLVKYCSAVWSLPVMLSGLEAKILASVSKIWSRPQTFGLGLASISLSYYVIGHFGGTIV